MTWSWFASTLWSVWPGAQDVKDSKLCLMPSPSVRAKSRDQVCNPCRLFHISDCLSLGRLNPENTTPPRDEQRYTASWTWWLTYMCVPPWQSIKEHHYSHLCGELFWSQKQSRRALSSLMTFFSESSDMIYSLWRSLLIQILLCATAGSWIVVSMLSMDLGISLRCPGGFWKGALRWSLDELDWGHRSKGI